MKKQLSSQRRRPGRSVLFTEIPPELGKTLKLIALDRGVHVSVWVRQQVVAAVKREAKRMGLKEDLRFLTGAARLRESGRGLEGLDDGEEGES